jgi:phosphatidylglycerol---prolipoprotein diacylglyceryl transferase
MQFEPVVLFTAAGFPVYAYGLCLALAAVFSGMLLAMNAVSRGVKKGTWSIFLLYALPLGVLCARLAYCSLRFNTYFYDADGMFRGLAVFFHLWEGGFAFYGAMGGVCLAALITARRTRASTAVLLDWIAPAAAIFAALARGAEILGSGGYGNIVGNSALRFFPVALYNDWMGEWNYSVFLLEAAAAAAIAFLLYRAGRKPHVQGDIALLFILFYASAQIVLERFRADDVLAWGFVLVSQVVSAILVLIISVLAGLRSLRTGGKRKTVIAEWTFALAVLAWSGLVEYLLQKSDIDNSLLYAIRAAALLVNAMFTSARLRKACRGQALGLVQPATNT